MHSCHRHAKPHRTFLSQYAIVARLCAGFCTCLLLAPFEIDFVVWFAVSNFSTKYLALASLPKQATSVDNFFSPFYAWLYGSCEFDVAR